MVNVRSLFAVSTSDTSAERSMGTVLFLSTLTLVSPATGRSLTGSTVIDTVFVAEVSGGSQGATEQLSGAPRSVTR